VSPSVHDQRCDILCRTCTRQTFKNATLNFHCMPTWCIYNHKLVEMNSKHMRGVINNPTPRCILRMLWRFSHSHTQTNILSLKSLQNNNQRCCFIEQQQQQQQVVATATHVETVECLLLNIHFSYAFIYTPCTKSVRGGQNRPGLTGVGVSPLCCWREFRMHPSLKATD
jgi:hypothetical protein